MNNKSLRIATWNCNGALRKKWGRLDALKADIYVVQECEDPGQTNDAAYHEWCVNHLWTGTNKNKGIGVFASSELTLQAVPMELAPLELFLPCLVDGVWPLLATWTKRANSPKFGYIGQLGHFLQKNREFLAHPHAMLVGDLNSNVIWNKLHPSWNHSDAVRELAELGLESCYHKSFSEEHGKESKPTFFQYRKSSKPYHIDYGFVGSQWSVQKVEVGAMDDWLGQSDHLPLMFELAHRSPPALAAINEIKVQSRLTTGELG